MDADQSTRLREIAEQQVKQIKGTHVFMSITSPDYVNDPLCLMQLGLAVLFDKPLFMLFVRGVKPSKCLIRILEGYECITGDDEADVKAASERLVQKINRFLERKAGE